MSKADPGMGSDTAMQLTSKPYHHTRIAKRLLKGVVPTQDRKYPKTSSQTGPPDWTGTRTRSNQRFRWPWADFVGLAGLEPAASSLSPIRGSPLCNPAFSQVVLLRKSYKDGVNLSVQPSVLATLFCPGPTYGVHLRLVWPRRASSRPARHREPGGGVDAARTVGLIYGHEGTFLERQ
jgi:hypothetical protein